MSRQRSSHPARRNTAASPSAAAARAAAERKRNPAAEPPAATPLHGARVRTPLMRSGFATIGIAAALSLSACGFLEGEPAETETPEAAQTTDAASGPKVESEGDGLTNPGEGAPTGDTAEADDAADGGESDGGSDDDSDGDSGEASDNGREGVGPEDGEPRTASLAGDDSIEIDDEGNGTVPKDALAADIEDLFVNKYDVPVEEVICTYDMTIVASRGSQNCEIVTAERSFYGTVAIIGFEGDMVEYELYFPGLDEDKLDLSDD